MWVWKRPEWPYNVQAVNKDDLSPSTRLWLGKFDRNNSISLRDTVLFENDDKDELVVSLQGIEALKTAEIEGERYQLASLKQSFRVHASIISKDARPSNDVPTSERQKSISAMTYHIYHTFAKTLDEGMLNLWNTMILGPQTKYSGSYRDYSEKMQVQNVTTGEIDFEAPASKSVPKEMDQFIEWFNESGLPQNDRMHPVIRAALAHLYFVTIHPYDDGNGRIARALALKVISQENKEPTLISLSHAIAENKTAYYNALSEATKNNNIHAWIDYFSETVVRAQELTKLKLYQAAVIKTHNGRHDLNNDQKNAIGYIMDGHCKKGASFITVSEYIECNKASLRERAAEENKKLTELAKEDLDDLRKKRVCKLSNEEGKAKYILVYPRTPEISEFFSADLFELPNNRIPAPSHATIPQ